MLPRNRRAYLYGQSGIWFPRADHVVIGGTFEVGVNNETNSRSARACQSP